MQSTPSSAFDANHRHGDGSQRPVISHHYVQFYENDAFLREVASDFLSAGLQAHEPLVVLATKEHRDWLLEQLHARRWDVDAVLRAGQLTMIDASDAYDQLIRDDPQTDEGVPDDLSDLLLKHQLIAPHQRVRIYGEVAGMLCESGRVSACRALEEGCNRLSHSFPLTLMCAYRIDSLGHPTNEALRQGVCDLHSHVLPLEHSEADSELQERLRHLTLLEQRMQTQAKQLAESPRLAAMLRSSLAPHEAKSSDAGEMVCQTLDAIHANLERLAAKSSELGEHELCARAGECQRMMSKLEQLLGHAMLLR
jgi:hypothetical protein